MRRRLGRYELYGEIGAGGMATVHLGALRAAGGFSKTVAIKRLYPELARDPELTELLRAEARLAARVTDGHVVQTLDVVEADGEPWLVLEYVHGETLDRLLASAERRAERPPPAIVSAIVAGVLRGLHAAHEATSEDGAPLGLVHRDVSPQNVIVGVDGLARVLDFGIARAAGRAKTTREGRVRGKIGYMAPEQLHGDTLTRAADIHAAAVVAWEALTGRRLFARETEAETIAAIEEHAAPPPSEVADDVPGAVNRVVLRGLARDPSARWATALEMANALEAAIAPASATEVGAWVRGLAREELARRDGLRRAGSHRVEGEGDDESASERSAPRSNRAAWIAVLAIAAGSTLAVWFARRDSARLAPPMIGESANATPSAAPIVKAARDTTAASPDVELPVVATTPRSPVPPSTRAPAPTASASAARPDCDPPYVADASGRLRFKRECLP